MCEAKGLAGKIREHVHRDMPAKQAGHTASEDTFVGLEAGRATGVFGG